MNRTLAVFRREFSGYFLTPIGYVVVGMFAAISGIAFTLSLVGYAKMSVAPTDYGYTTTPDLGETLLSPYLVFCGNPWAERTDYATALAVGGEGSGRDIENHH